MKLLYHNDTRFPVRLHIGSLPQKSGERDVPPYGSAEFEIPAGANVYVKAWPGNVIMVQPITWEEA